MRLCEHRSQARRDVKEKHLTDRGVEPLFSNPESNHYTDCSAIHSRVLAKVWFVKSEVWRRFESPGMWMVYRLVNRHGHYIPKDFSLQQYFVCYTEVCSFASGNDCVCSFLLPHSCCHKVTACVFACLCCGLWMVHFDPREAAVACCHLRNGEWEKWLWAR